MSHRQGSGAFVKMAGVRAQVCDEQGAGGGSTVDGHCDSGSDRHAGERQGGRRRVRAKPGRRPLCPQASKTLR